MHWSVAAAASGVDSGVGRVVLDQETIQTRVTELAREISEDFRGREIVLVTVLSGGFQFACDLARRLTVPVYMDFVSLTRFAPGGTVSGIEVVKDVEESLGGRDILIVEDIVDTGLSLNFLINELGQKNPASLQTCTLLERPELRLIDLPIPYRGFSVSEEFLVGYGLDYKGLYRNLPFIATLDEEEARLL